MKELVFMTWKPCPGLEDNYIVSNHGKIKSIDRDIVGRKGIVKGVELTQRPNHKGYLTVRVAINRKSEDRSVHRLTALAFIPNPNNLPQVNHKDGNKRNNCVSNLEWVSNSQNQLHAYKHGLQPSRAGENNSKAKVSYEDVTKFKTEYNSGRSIVILSEEMSIPLGILRNIIYGRTWKSHTMKILKRDDRSKTKKPILL